MTNFEPPQLPAANNSTGAPMPPSGLHDSVSPQVVFTPTGHGWAPVHPSAVGENVHGTPAPPSGLHAVLGRVAAWLGRKG
jgi:hypothetical protein